MSYNTKNYTEQGGETTHIGGSLVIDEGGSVQGLPSPSLPIAILYMGAFNHLYLTEDNQDFKYALKYEDIWNLFHNQGKIVLFIKTTSENNSVTRTIYLVTKMEYDVTNNGYSICYRAGGTPSEMQSAAAANATF